jgi:hypothetical protein
MRTLLSLVLLLGVALAASACEEPDVFLANQGILGGPSGVLDGTVAYSGPLPCTAGGSVIGAAIILALDTRLLPPPDGLGTSAASLAVVPGSELFGGVMDQLTFNPDGSMWCPPADAAPVLVSDSWTDAPLPAATYQVRSFYDYAGTFDPVFSISNLPVKGDIGGGALENPIQAAGGAAPVYREITLGTCPAGSSVCQGASCCATGSGASPDVVGPLQMPSTGARVSGVTVNLGLPLTLNRPVFYPTGIQDMYGTNKVATSVSIPADLELKYFSGNPADVSMSEDSLVRFTFTAGVPAKEQATAAVSPFFMPVENPAPSFTYSLQADSIPETASSAIKVPALYPLAVFALLTPGTPLASQTQPVVVLEGLTIYKSLLDTALYPKTATMTSSTLIVGLRPSVLCIDPLGSADGVLLVTHETDEATPGNPLVPPGVTAALSAQFGRTITAMYGCLPMGDYSMNLIYGTGQAWTLPNEAGICAADEPSSPGGPDGMLCGTRAQLTSQTAVLTVGPPGIASYCVSHPTPVTCCATGAVGPNGLCVPLPPQ